MDEALLLKVLNSKLSIPHSSESKDDIDHTTALISNALQKAIEESISLLKECSRSIAG